MTPDKILVKYLFDMGFIAPADLAMIDAAGGRDPLGVLVSAGKITEDDLFRAKAHILGIPFVDLRSEKIERAALMIIPEPIARAHNLIAYKQNGNIVEIALLDMDSLQVVGFIAKESGLKILPRLTNKESIRHGLLQYQKYLKAEFGDSIARDAGHISGDAGGEFGGDFDWIKMIHEHAPSSRLVDSILRHAKIERASDIHIEPRADNLMVRYRINGMLHDAIVLPKKLAAGIVSRIKTMLGVSPDEKGHIHGETASQNGVAPGDRFHVSILPTQFGEKIVARISRRGSLGHTLESLGFYGSGLRAIHEALGRQGGLIVVASPVESGGPPVPNGTFGRGGQTRTEHALLDMLSDGSVAASSLGVSQDHNLPNVSHVSVDDKIGLTYAAGLRAILRQDPDIILIDGLRDSETAMLAVSAALSGRTVIVSVDALSGGDAIASLLNFGVAPSALASALKVVVAERPVRQLAKINEEYKLSLAERKALEGIVPVSHVVDALRGEGVIGPDDDIGAVRFYKPKMSDNYPTGFSGRIVLREVMNISPEIKAALAAGVSAPEIEDLAKSAGMISFIKDGLYKASRGLTTIDEVLRMAGK